MKRCACFVLSAIFLLTSCARETDEKPPHVDAPPPSDFDVFLREVNDRRRADIGTEVKPDVSQWTLDRAPLTNPFTLEELERMLVPHEEGERFFTTAELQEDAETAFALLKRSYAGYEYFGGDEVFLPLLDQVKADVEGDQRDFSLAKALYQALQPVVMDRHFAVDGNRLQCRKSMYYVPGLYFDDPAGLDPEYARPTVADDGRIAYGFFAVTADPADLPERTVVNGETVALDWIASTPIGDDSFSYRETRWGSCPSSSPAPCAPAPRRRRPSLRPSPPPAPAGRRSRSLSLTPGAIPGAGPAMCWIGFSTIPAASPGRRRPTPTRSAAWRPRRWAIRWRRREAGRPTATRGNSRKTAI